MYDAGLKFSAELQIIKFSDVCIWIQSPFRLFCVSVNHWQHCFRQQTGFCKLFLRSRASLVPRPSSLVGKNKGEEGLVELIT